MTKNNVAIITGEISGDLYAYELGKKLKKKGLRIIGIGGNKLQSIADQFLINIAHENIIGVEAFFQIALKKRLKEALRHIASNNELRCIILIDFQHHHHLIAKIIKQHHIPIITFITPNFWIWKDTKKAKEVISYSTEIVTIFKKEYLFYKTLTPHVHFFGHPLPFIQDQDIAAKPPFLDPKTSIALFPGSRKQEFKLYFDSICNAVKGLLEHPTTSSYSFHMAVSSPEFLPVIQTSLQRYGLNAHIQLWHTHQHHLLKNATAVICATGTTTLQCILHQKPMVILCGLSPLTYWIAKHILKLSLPFISLPNIMANAPLVPELVQENVTAPNIVNALHSVLSLSAADISRSYAPLIEELSQKNPFEGISDLVSKKC